MATDKYLKELLLRYRTIVVVGFSKNDNKIANRIPMALKAIGYNIVPVNPTMKIYEGINVFGSLSDVKKAGISLELIEIFRPSSEAEIIAFDGMKLGAKAIWLQTGIISEHAKEAAMKLGIDYVHDRCIYEDYINLFGSKHLSEIV